ncbi:hypothetical protein M8J75_004343 [Diaphorina citri]|nr:hypothetical protein M8J75_004343 [Diaphorina citri]
MRIIFLLATLLTISSANLIPGKRKVIIDTDGGGDDIMAIITALRLPTDIQVLGITTGCGNVNATQATVNVLKTLRVLNRTEVSLKKPQRLNLQQPQVNKLGKLGISSQISLICLGPLTNVAHAIKLYPGFLDNLQQIIVMGGSVKGIGNDSPGTEFNFRRDPEATRLVFEHASIEHPVYLLPWETSVDAHITKEWRVNVLGAINNTLMDFMNKVERVVLDRNLTYWQSPDSMAVLAFSQPEVIASMFTPKVYVLSEGELARGVTLLDRDTNNTNSKVISYIRVDLFKKLLLRTFRED